MPRAGDCVELRQVEGEIRLEGQPALTLKHSHAINAPFLPRNMLLKAPPQAAIDIELLLKWPVFVIPPRFCVIPKPIEIGACDIHPMWALSQICRIEVHHGRGDRLAALFGVECDDLPNTAGFAKWIK